MAHFRLKRLIRRLRPQGLKVPLIRIGGAADGGYLIPDCLDKVDVCFSPGVDVMCDFELELAGHGIRSELTDYSVDGPPIPHELFHFEKKFLGAENSDEYQRFDTWVERRSKRSDSLLLQMDIEGAEYPVLASTARKVLQRFSVMVIEFHGLQRLFDRKRFRQANRVFQKILKDFDVVHLHPNNCCRVVSRGSLQIPQVMEFTFVAKRLKLTQSERTTPIPHPLDARNLPDKPDRELPACWIGPSVAH